MGAKFLTLDNPTVETSDPASQTRVRTFRRREVAHRGRSVTFVAVESTDAKKDAMCMCLLLLIEKYRENGNA
jgi:hypothetical protein